MSLSEQQKKFIYWLDKQATHALQKGGDEALLMMLANHMHKIKELMDEGEDDELDFYCEKYDGFYQCINLLERLAAAIADGTINPGAVCNDTTKKPESLDELQTIMTKAMLEMQRISELTPSENKTFIPVIKLFIQGVVSTAIDIASVRFPGAGVYLYADLEAMAKEGGLREIAQAQSRNGSPSYSVSNIEPDDVNTAMNYLGQQLSITIYKALHELPESLRTQEMPLRGIEVLLANLLDQKFGDPHRILDQFCEHVHNCLHDLETRRKNKLTVVK